MFGKSRSLYSTIRPLFLRPLSTNANASSHLTNKQKILAAALPHVHAHGWTERAIAEGVLTSNLPPSYIGLIADKQSEVIHYFMNDCNEKLSKAFQEKNIESENLSHAQVMEWGIRTRLEMNIPYVRSQRWHEGMALGAMPANTFETANHLEKMVKIIEGGMMRCSDKDSKHPAGTTFSFGLLERGAIGALYVATELHLLSDGSAEYQESWSFLRQRVQELELAARAQGSNVRHFPSSDIFVAGTAIASSLGGAVFSLLAPSSTATCGLSSVAGGVIPQIMSFVQQPSSVDSTIGTKAQDYDFSDLPPFETEEQKDGLKQ